MFRILITSAVYMWHFVYLTVLLFFCYFSSMVAITGWMVHSLLQEANDRAMRLWDGGKEKEEESCCPSDRQRWRWTRKLSSPVCGGRSLTRTSACPFHPPLSGWRRWWDGLTGWLGGLISLFWHCLWWSKWSSTTLAHLADEGEDANVSVFTKQHRPKQAG